MDIEKLIRKAKGISQDLDFTLLALTETLETTEVTELNEEIEELQKELSDLKQVIKNIKIELLNREVSEGELIAARKKIEDEFRRAPNVLYWFIDAYNLSFFQLLEKPALCKTICEELILQMSIYFPEMEPPELWTSIKNNDGLIPEFYLSDKENIEEDLL